MEKKPVENYEKKSFLEKLFGGRKNKPPKAPRPDVMGLVPYEAPKDNPEEEIVELEGDVCAPTEEPMDAVMIDGGVCAPSEEPMLAGMVLAEEEQQDNSSEESGKDGETDRLGKAEE